MFVWPPRAGLTAELGETGTFIVRPYCSQGLAPHGNSNYSKKLSKVPLGSLTWSWVTVG